jgi:hypothetical protein
MYIPYQFTKTLEDERLRVAARRHLAAAARREHRKTRGTRATRHRLARVLLARPAA